MKNAFILIHTLLITLTVTAQTDSINQRIFLIGDAGELRGSQQPVVDYVAKHADMNDAKNTVIYLGDNIYPHGLPMEGEHDYPEMKKILDYQINLVRGKKAKGYFVLGNHDWENGKLGGWQRALNQENYINGLEQKNLQVLPTEGCPGPVAVELSNKVVGVFIDSQWFLYVHEKPGPGSNCGAATLESFRTELSEIAASYPNHMLLLITHHPMYTYGPHGGDYTLKEHIFPFTALKPNLYIPLPIIGSIYPITRGVFGSLQDTKHPLYKNMREIIEGVMKQHKNALHVAGHEHVLEMIVKNDLPFIVSGSAINLSDIRKEHKGKLLFAETRENGFVMLEIRNSGKVEAKFYTISSPNLNTPKYTYQLDSIINIPEPKVVKTDSIPTWPDSITVVANPDLKAGALKRFLMGKNYRDEWTTPIRVEVLDMGKAEGGLTPDKLGGGKQTKSLRVVDKSGKEWSLRSIKKFPEAAIPAELRTEFAKDVVEDGVSASYPFASLSVPVLANAAGVPTLRRRLVYVPDDPRLGRFRSTFKNTLAIMEERRPVGIQKADNTDELVLRLAKDNDDHVDQRAVLKARLLDNFYMDFDRHEGQWSWATRDTGKGKIYYPIPKDQDQAFFINQGLIPWFASKDGLVPQLQGFEKKADNIRTLNVPARNFDRFFLNELDRPVWEKQVDSFLNQMTDEVIDLAISRQPREIQRFHAQKIASTLKERRKYFKKEMMKYYEFLSKEVNIVGTNQRELVTVNKMEDGRTTITLNKIDKQGQISSKIYERIFDPSVTKELRIYGLADEDSFVVTGGQTPIKIRMIGGPGEDAFYNAEGSEGKLQVYDVLFEKNQFYGNVAGLKERLSPDPRNNMYNRIFYKYSIKDPGLSFAYNVDDGFFLGLDYKSTSHSFRKEPFAARHRFAAGRAFNTGSMYFRYDGEINKVMGNSDLVLRADVRAPVNITNFFGLGNNTIYNQERNIRFYRARYNVINASVLFRRQLQSWMRVYAGPVGQFFKVPTEENKDRFLGQGQVPGLDPATLDKPRTYAGAEATLEINSRNSPSVPTRGFTLDAGVRQLFALNNSNRHVTQLRWDMSVIASFVPRAKFVIATRVGWYHNLGRFEFPQANYLSGPTNLRGYRRDRFGGRTMAFNNTELRFKLGDINTYLFPGSLGLLVFHDVGRVWQDGESSNTWHTGYGAGLWIAPVQRFVITLAAARSKEEKLLPYVNFGFAF
jgi:hypothetical protein